MPQIIPFIATLIAEFFVGASMYGAIVAAYISTALYIGLAVGVFLLIPKRPDQLTNPIEGRTTTVREPVTSRKLIYGEIKISGPIILLESTNNNKRWHLVIPIAGHEVQKMGTVYFNDHPIFEDHIDVNGFVTQGIFSGKARIRKNLGSDSQVADPVLVSEITKWTNEHRGRGVAYLYIQIDYDRDTYPTGLPNIAVIVQGRKVFDPRISGTFYNPNTALSIRDFLTDKKYGVGAEDSEIDVTFFNSDANTSDEFVLAPIHLHIIESVDTVNDEFTLDGTSLIFFIENKIRLTTTGTLPTNFLLNTDYFVIVSSLIGRVIKLATTRQNARDGIAIDIVDSGTGTHTITRKVLHTVLGVDLVSDFLRLNEERLLFQTADKVRLETTGTAPGGLAILTDYFIIVFHEQNIVDDDDVIQFDCGIQLATSLTNALAGNQINITDAGTGTHIIIKIAEPRYTCNGLVDTKVSGFNILREMLTSGGGSVTKIGATWKSYVAVFRSATASFDEDDVIGQIKTPSKISRAKRFNRIKGIYVSPKNDWEPQDYPAVTKTAFQTEDGKVIDFELNFPFTTRTQQAQRLAQIFLKRSRNEMIMEVPLKLPAIEIQAGNNFKFSNIIRGFTDKIFEVITSEFSVQKDKENRPIFAMNFVTKSTISTDYDFDPNVDEIMTDGDPQSDLKSAFFVSAPEGLTVIEEIFEGRQGAGVKSRVKVSWNPSTDGLARWFQVEHKLASDPVFFKSPSTQDFSFNIDDLKPGLYDVQVKAISELGTSSIFVSKQITVSGLLAPPEEPQNMTITIVGGSAYVRWTQVVDLDVRVGGEILFRHSRKLIGATWQESVSIGEKIGGAETLVVLPLKAGSYLAKSKDSEGVLSIATALVTTKQAQIQNYTTSGTINEHPNFVGTKVGVVVDAANNLRLAGGILFDSWSSVDAVPNFDIGSDGISLVEGIYTFGAVFNLGSVQKRRVTTTINAININVFLTIDDRSDFMDDWSDFDQAGVDAPADASIWMRQTDDDPTGAPVFGPYERIEAVEVQAWGLEFQCRLITTSKDHNILIDELTVKQETLV